MTLATIASTATAGDLERRGFTGSAHLLAGVATTARLRDNRSVRLRVAEMSDAGELTAMHARSSAASVIDRYGAYPPLTGRFLEQLLGRDTAIVAEAPNRSLVALGNLGRDDTGSGDLAVLVEDGWQGVGLGSTMLGHLVTIARLVGYAEVRTRRDSRHGWGHATLARFGTLVVDQDALRLPLRRQPSTVPRQLGAA